MIELPFQKARPALVGSRGFEGLMGSRSAMFRVGEKFLAMRLFLGIDAPSLREWNRAMAIRDLLYVRPQGDHDAD